MRVPVVLAVVLLLATFEHSLAVNVTLPAECRDSFIKGIYDQLNIYRIDHGASKFLVIQETSLKAEVDDFLAKLQQSGIEDTKFIGNQIIYELTHIKTDADFLASNCEEIARDIVTEWYKQRCAYPFDDPPRSSNASFSEFSLLVWRASTSAYCGFSVNRSEAGKYSIYVACRYEPRGDVEGKFAENVHDSKSPIPAACFDRFKKAIIEKHHFYRALHGAQELVWDKGCRNHAAAVVEQLDSNEVNDTRFAELCYRYELSSIKNESDLEKLGERCHLAAYQAVDFWYSESASYDFKHAPSKADDKFRAFSQLVWKGTSKLGCALKVQHEGGEKGGYVLYVVCSYWPVGNVAGHFGENVGEENKEAAKSGLAAHKACEETTVDRFAVVTDPRCEHCENFDCKGCGANGQLNCRLCGGFPYHPCL